MCECSKLGGPLCDYCASRVVGAITGLLPDDPYAAELPAVLTPSERQALTSLADNYSGMLEQEQSSQKEGGR